LDNEQIKTMVTNYKHAFVPPELFYAESADDVVRIYENGPNSCMMGKGWNDENHPTRIYFGPDTKLAYIKNKSGAGISARCLIRTDKTPPQFIKIYGDKDLMKKALQAAGIEQSTTGVKGCRFPLLWIKDNKDKMLLMPYIDGGIKQAYISKDRKNREHMMIGKLPTEDSKMYYVLSSTPTSGVVTMPDVSACGRCDKLEFNEKVVIVEGAHYCESCSEGLDIITINEGQERLEKRVTLETAQRHYASYFEIGGSWYSQDGLKKINKFYDNNKEQIINFSETEIEYNTGERMPKAELLTLHTTDKTVHFYRRNHASLVSSFMNHDTFEFYTNKKANILIKEGATNISIVNERLNAMLVELRIIANSEESNYIPKIADRLTEHKATRDFLQVYLSHYNNNSDYL